MSYRLQASDEMLELIGQYETSTLSSAHSFSLSPDVACPSTHGRKYSRVVLLTALFSVFVAAVLLSRATVNDSMPPDAAEAYRPKPEF